MLNVEAWAIDKLEADSALVALLGTADRIMKGRPATIEILPLVTVGEVNQTSEAYSDDAPNMDESLIEVHVWTGDAGTFAIAAAVDAVMIGLGFDREYSNNIPDPDLGIQHRTSRYRRKFSADDLI